VNDLPANPSKTEIRRASAHVFELLLEWFPDIIQSVDPDGNIVYINRRAEQLLGYTRDELLGMNILALYAPEVAEEVKKGFQKLQKKGTLEGIESIVCTKDGQRIPVEIRSFAVYDSNGTFLRTFSILRDIRQIKVLQNSLIHAGRLAAIGELASCIAHDISNPLAVIKLYAELLSTYTEALANYGLDEDAGKIGDAREGIVKAADKIEKLVNHLRDFSRNETQAKPQLVDIRRVIEDALFMVSNKIDKGRVRVIRQWQEDQACYVMAKSNELEQVFMNLFSNACDAMERVESPTIWVRIEYAPPCEDDPRPYWVCHVSDCGEGIPEEHLGQIFKSFFTTKEKGKGTGLGLTITRNIIRRHDGEITVNSVVGKGTTFSVRLPAWKWEADDS